MKVTTTRSPGELSTLDDINRLGIAFAGAKVVLCAIELGLFTRLAVEPATAEQLCAQVGLHPRAVRDFLAVLVSAGLLRCEDDVYHNTPVADRYLDRAKPTYGGAFLERADRMMYPAWTNLSGLLTTGAPQLAGREDQVAAFERMMADQDHLRKFLRMMDAVSGPLGPELAAAVDWTPYRSVLDVGGARGNLLIQILKAHPHLTGAVFDLPPIGPMFDEHVAAAGLTDRTRFVAGDAFADDLPATDVVVTGHVLHDWDPAQRAELVRRMAAAVNPGGLLLIYDQLIEEAPTDPWNSLISLNMQLISPGGSEYTLAECRGWLDAAGLAFTRAVPLGGHDTLVVATRPVAA